MVTAGPAFGNRSPLRGVNWSLGATSPFAYTRFDGQYDGANKRIYFLGGRLQDNSTSGEVWYYDTVAKTYTDTGVAMPDPVTKRVAQERRRELMRRQQEISAARRRRWVGRTVEVLVEARS